MEKREGMRKKRGDEKKNEKREGFGYYLLMGFRLRCKKRLWKRIMLTPLTRRCGTELILLPFLSTRY
jgi:hypothetical protein